MTEKLQLGDLSPDQLRDMPKPATTLVRRLVGWSHDIQCSDSMPVEFGGLSEQPGADGKRRRVSIVETCDAVLVRAKHVDTRALIVFWIRRPGGPWKFDFALRGRDLTNDHDGPKRINSRQLAAYVAAPGLRTALRAVTELAPKVKTELEEVA